MTITTITPNELEAQRQAGETIELIDVRTPVEFRELHASIARNIPLDRLDPAEVHASRNGNGDKPLYVICRTGSRAKKACEQIVGAGFPNVVNVEGGTIGWEKAGLPVVHGKKMISLERQVRIAAGMLTLIGAILALTIDPWFALLPAFIGAGLTFAGITDTCGMGLMLARMPWNQVPECADGEQSCEK